MKPEIIERLLNQKYDSLARKEKDIIVNQWDKLRNIDSNSPQSKQLTEDLFNRFGEEDRNCNSILYGCKGGFIIHRTFAQEYKKQFKIVITDKDVEEFIREIPVKEKSGTILNLYKVLENTIGIKLKVRNAFKLGGKDKGLGVGFLKIDAFELIIAKNEDIEAVIEDMRDIFKLDLKLKNIESENLNLRKQIKIINQINSPLIITEGKTDWKHFISALRQFHSKNEYTEIKEEWFLKYGSEQDKNESICGTEFILNCSVAELNKILNSFVDSNKFNKNNSHNLRVGIFDSDDSNAKIITDKESKTYSFILEPNNISIEMLYSEIEIKTEINGKRLYLGEEFDKRTKRHLTNKELNIGGSNNSLNKAGVRKILDCDVYNIDGENIALTKESFAQKIFTKEIKISTESWNNFKHIFEKIKKIVK